MFNVDFVTMITNIANEAVVGGPIWDLVTAFCYFMSFVLLFVTVRQLKDIGENKGQSSYAAPLLTFISASLLASVPSVLATVAVSIFGQNTNTNILVYSTSQISSSPIKAVLVVVQMVGYFFFVRGILELRRAGEPNRFQGASINKAIVILLSGMAAIYINYTLQVIGSFTGWNVDAILN